MTRPTWAKFWPTASCYGTRSRTHLFHCTFTAFNYRFSFHIYRSYYILCWHLLICCMVVHFSLFLFLIADAYLPSQRHIDSFPLSHLYSMTFQHVLFPGPCAYLGHINTAPICTTSLKLVLVFIASNPVSLSLPVSGKIFVYKYFVTSTCIVSELSIRRFGSRPSFSSWSPIGQTSVSLWASPA